MAYLFKGKHAPSEDGVGAVFELPHCVPAQVHDRGDLTIVEAVVRERDELALVWVELADGVTDLLAILASE